MEKSSCEQMTHGCAFHYNPYSDTEPEDRRKLEPSRVGYSEINRRNSLFAFDTQSSLH